jgi:REP element-mobilizing transposase RayT
VQFSDGLNQEQSIKGFTMTQPRKTLISISDTPYYHLISRCVRRAYLCGTDANTGQCYEHRRLWIEERIRLLSSIFSIDICAYSVMSNHVHIVAKICPEAINNMTDQQIIKHWCCLFKGPISIQRFSKGEPLSDSEMKVVSDFISVYRKRLCDLSWFMKCLKQPIAKMANKEDNCTGHFWEARFKSQALLTEEALLTCMAYVDLNPIRARMANTPETSEHTSIKERIKPEFDLEHAIEQQQKEEELNNFTLHIKPLWDFDNETLFTEQDYLILVDTTGRIIRENKRGFIPDHLPNILERLNIELDDWINSTQQFEQGYQRRFGKRRRKSA